MNILKTSLKIFAKLWLILGIALTINCGNSAETIIGSGITPIDYPTIPETLVEPIYVWGNYFHADGSTYEELLERCSRCGLKRVRPGTGGWGAGYEVHVPFSRRNPKRCSNWGNEGYIQIEFDQDKLPTGATVTISPKYVNGSVVFWGEPFSVKSQALPINENKGFQILLSPSQGLGGNKNLIIRSLSDHHVKGRDLHIEAIYGGGSLARDSYQTAMFSSTLEKQLERPVESEKVKYSCLEYTN